MSNFNIGDRVIVKSSTLGSDVYGKTGTLISTHDYSAYPYRVEFDDGVSVPANTHEIELVKENKVSTAVKGEEFQVGDKVSAVGVVTKITKSYQGDGLDVVTISFNDGSDTNDQVALWTTQTQITLIERPEKPVEIGTQVSDSHGCKFILGSLGGIQQWIRIESVEDRYNDQDHYSLNSWAGKALTEIARGQA